MNEPGPVASDERELTRPVFISYSSADRKEALAVCKAIERRGPSCWISCRDVLAGENYQESIVRALRNSRAMVLVFSEAANNSDEIKKELSLASRYHVPLLAVRIEDVEPSDAFAYELSTRQWIDAFQSWDKSIDSLVKRIGEVSGAPQAAPAPAPARKAQRRGFRGSRGLLAASAAALLLLIGGGVWWLTRSTPIAAHTLQVRLAGFQRLSNDISPALPQAMADEISASFNDDGVVSVSTASAPAPGNAPAYAISGTARREGDKIKVFVRLTNERTGPTLWSNEFAYDATLAPRVPHLAAIDSSMVVRCGLFGASTYAKPMPDNVLIPYLGFCQGSDGPEASKALNFAQKTVAIAPDFSWGWSGVAVAATGAWFTSHEKDEAARKAGLEAADRAISIDPSNSEAYAYKGSLTDKYDLVAQEALFKKALSARPLPCGCEHHIYGTFLFETGRIKDAIAQYKAGIAVLPLNAATQFSLGSALLADGSPDAAKHALDAAADLDSDPTDQQQIAVIMAPFTHDYADGAKAYADPRMPGTQQYREAMADAFKALASGAADTRAAAAQKLSAATSPFIEDQTNIIAALGADNLAFQKIDTSVRNGSGLSRMGIWFPTMDKVRRDPSFPAFLQRVGLMRYWKESHTRPDVCLASDPPPFCRMI